MEKPNLDRTWEAYIRIGPPQTATVQQVFGLIRSKLRPMLSCMKTDKMIKWYCFLIHGSRTKSDTNLYFHIRFEPKDGIDDVDSVNEILPVYCEKELTAKFTDVEGKAREISGIERSLVKNEEIEEVWRILGEQSEWLMNMLSIYREDVEIPVGQITQFMHFYLNMLGLGGQAVLHLGQAIFQF